MSSKVECRDLLEEAVHLTSGDAHTTTTTPFSSSSTPADPVNIPPLCCDPWVSFRLRSGIAYTLNSFSKTSFGYISSIIVTTDDKRWWNHLPHYIYLSITLACVRQYFTYSCTLMLLVAWTFFRIHFLLKFSIYIIAVSVYAFFVLDFAEVGYSLNFCFPHLLLREWFIQISWFSSVQANHWMNSCQA